MTNDKLFVWAVNSSDDSVYVINANTNAVTSKITVGDDPQAIALDPNSEYAYVANAAGNSVSVIHITGGGAGGNVERTYATGAEPWNVVISPDGKRVYVANSVQDTITILKSDVAFPTLPSIIGNVELNNSACNADNSKRHFQPRGLAVTLDSNKLYVTRFLSMVKLGGTQANDNGKEGLVCRLDIDTDAATKAASV
ncbi:MAG: YncE family protein [Anaerolineae bacterium]|nr:YncE family protein [Anaerolineae bacterium]